MELRRHPVMQARTVLAGALGALALARASSAAAAVVHDIHVLRDATTTRLVVGIDQPVRFRSHTSEDGRAIFIDLGDTTLDADAPRVLPVSDRRIDGVLVVSDEDSRIVRVSVDFAGHVPPSVQGRIEDGQLLLDFRAAGAAADSSSSSASRSYVPRPGAAGRERDGDSAAVHRVSPRSLPEPSRPSPAASPRAVREEGEGSDDSSALQLARAKARARARARAQATGATADAESRAGAAAPSHPAPVAVPQSQRAGKDVEAAARPATSPRRSVLERPVVVLDPGHGGKDPGARAWTGEVEKDIVLDLAERVARRLRKAGDVEVVMTRSGDEFIELSDRRETSQRWNADAFVSIHANASHNVAARGIETYYHSRTTSDRGMRRLARAENGGAPARGASPSPRAASPGALSRTSLSRSAAPVLDRRSESIRLAKAVQGELVRQLGMRYEAVRDLGAKEGPFFVIGENAAPSVLVEAAFLTHREEGLRMRSEVYREQIADGVARGILLFLEQQRRAGTL